MKIPDKCDALGCQKLATRWFLHPAYVETRLRGRCDQHAASLVYRFSGKFSSNFEEKTRDELLVMEIHEA